MNEQRDSHSDYIAHMWVVQNFDVRSLKYCFIDDFDLHIYDLI